MRLVCQSCGIRFKISDDLVRGKFVRFRCKQCGSVLEAHLPRHQPGPAAAELAAGGEPSLSEAAARHEPPPLPERVWFVAVGGRRVGPLATEEVRLCIRRREIGAEDLAWRKGLGLWQPVVALDDLNGALNEPPLAPELQPPPLPVRPGPAPVLRLVAGAGQVVAALADPQLDPEPLPRPRPVLTPTPVPPPPARWPLWVALLGGLMMVGSAAVLVVRRAPAAIELQAATGQRDQPTPPVASLRIRPESNTGEPAMAVLPAIEVRRSRPGASPSLVQSGEALPDHLPQVAGAWGGDVPGLGGQVDDLKTALAMRIYRRNRATLTACDQLAERRGDVVRRGSRAEFEVRSTAAGTEVEVTGREIPAALLACYRAVSSRWEIPSLGTDEYSTSFVHVH